MDEHWYVATLLMQIHVDDDQAHDSWTCDEQILVLRASDDEAALQKALRFGAEKQVSYQNMAGQTVFWEFVGIIDLKPLDADTIEDGTEIKSRLFSHSDPASLVWSRNESPHQAR